MQFKLHHALMAMGALLITSCTSDGPVNPVNENNTKQETLGFTVNHKNMTKADFKEVYQDFSVWGSNDYAETPGLIFDNYKVAYDEDADPQWYYAGIGEQELKYWDSRADFYYFWAFAPYNASAAYDATSKVVTYPWTAGFKTSADDIKDVAVAKTTTVEYLLFGDDVILNFTRMNGMLNIKFYENLANYEVTVTSCEIVETNYYASANLVYNRTDDTTGVDTPTNGTDALNFGVPTGTIGISKEAASPCPNTYYFVPFAERPVKVKLTYTISNPTTHATKTFTDQVVVLNDNLSWNANTAYTYYIRFTKNGNHTPGDGAKPIKFGDPTLDDYTPADADFDIVITNLNI